MVRWIYNVLPVSGKGKAVVVVPNGKKVVLENNGDVKGDVN